MCTIDADGTDEKRLLASGFNDTPSWSRDGRKIIFSRYDPSTATVQIHTRDAGGAGLTRVTTSAGHKFQPVWSPDKTKIAFVRGGQVGDADIFVMNAHGSGERNVTRHPANDFDPAWSPDGSRLAFTRERRDSFGIYVMNADGGGVARLAPDGLTPAWSPDGATLAFSGRGLHLLDVETGEVERLTTRRFDTEPSWSPDGRYIVFRRGEHGPNAELYVITADGSMLRRLTTNRSPEGVPAWSPE